MEDKRFAHLKTDPKFRHIPKGARKVKIDKRFQSMFKEKKFKVKYTSDKRGRPVSHTSTEDLKRYYDLSSGESSSEDEPNEIEKPDKVETTSDLNVKLKTDKVISKKIKRKLKDLSVDYARGEANLFSESSSDDEESEGEVPEGEEIEHNWGELDNDAEQTEEETYRLAACNMDWDRIRAVDLMVLLNSFVPPGGAVKSVTIYPSEFGKERMKEEEIKGPTELVEDRTGAEDGDNEEGSKYHMEKLRQYQLNRLKYYYAVIQCDGVATASKIYSECDGMEYESSSTKIDLRFIPDEMTFDDEPKEACDGLPDLKKYEPRFFTTTALQQAKVDLTWDETDPNRVELFQKLNSGKLEDVSDKDLQKYFAVNDGESDEEDEEVEKDDDNGDKKNSINKYKLLLQEMEKKEEEKEDGEFDMEVSWAIDVKDKAEELVKKRMGDEERAPFQKYLDKRKEKRKEKKKQRKEEENDSDDHKQTSKKKEKKKKKNGENRQETDQELELLLTDDNKVDEFEVNVNDERFSALFTSHLYNIDPTSSQYKKTKGMETLIKEKINRRSDEPEVKETKKDAELSALVKTVKRKTLDSFPLKTMKKKKK